MVGAMRLTPADLRALLRLCHALHTSTDTDWRKRQFLAALCDLLECGSALSVVALVEPARRRHTTVSVAAHGSARLSEAQVLARCLKGLDRRQRIESAPGWQHSGGATRSRGRTLHHSLWREAPGSDDLVVACIGVERRPHDCRPFDQRQRLLLHLAHLEMSWVYEHDLLLASSDAASLSPRQRQTLEYLLAGHSEKQIAERMRLSPNTVHHHVKALHKHFGVSSRSELLARWVK